MSAAPAIQTDSLTKTYRSLLSRREVQAVRSISLTVDRGTTFGLLGPNGAGKTTFVKMLLSAVHPSSGAARLFGLDSHAPEARRPVGYLPENHRFPTYFTAAGMLDFYGALSGLSSSDRKRRIPELLDLTGLSQWSAMRLGKFSKGMLQRIGLAQALLHSPSLLILDEPTDGVDPVGRRQVREILHSLEQRGVTIFLNSHLLAEVELFCRDVAIIHKGQLALIGKVKELTAGKGYRLTVPLDLPENLRDALTAKATATATRDGLLDFQFPSRTAANAALDLLRTGQSEVEALTPTTSTLEEVFIRTING